MDLNPLASPHSVETHTALITTSLLTVAMALNLTEAMVPNHPTVVNHHPTVVNPTATTASWPAKLDRLATATPTETSPAIIIMTRPTIMITLVMHSTSSVKTVTAPLISTRTRSTTKTTLMATSTIMEASAINNLMMVTTQVTMVPKTMAATPDTDKHRTNMVSLPEFQVLKVVS
jgi:hypothetical protein